MGHISIIPDYRQAWKVEHKLSDILLLTICAVISGAEGWEDIEDFGETHLDFLKQYGDFENGIPVHDTIARVVSCISPAKFHECFINWMRDCHSSDDKDVIAEDASFRDDESTRRYIDTAICKNTAAQASSKPLRKTKNHIHTILVFEKY